MTRLFSAGSCTGQCSDGDDPMAKRNQDDPRYDEWPVEGHASREVNYLGISNGAPQFYRPDTNSIYRGTVDERNRRIRLNETSQRTLKPEETLGDVIKALGERTGWDSLSEFAQEHFSTDEGTDDDA